MKKENSITVTAAVIENDGKILIGKRKGGIDIEGKWEFNPTAHDDIKWVTPNELDNFEFAPADIPILKKINETFHF